MKGKKDGPNVEGDIVASEEAENTPQKILRYYPEISTDTDEVVQARKDTHQIELRR